MTKAFIQDIYLTPNRMAKLTLWKEWLSPLDADRLLSMAIGGIPWREDQIQMFGRKIPIPRLQNWFSSDGTSYKYSKLALSPLILPKWMEGLRKSIEKQTNNSFNGILANYYRDGKDSVGWHADDERSLGFEPVIASLSLGAERSFELKHKNTKENLNIILPHGSLLLMSAGIQSYWLHRINKVNGGVEPRINLTFRKVLFNE